MNAFWIGVVACIVAMFGVTLALPTNDLDEEALLQLFSKTDGVSRNSLLQNILTDKIEDLRGIMVKGNDVIPVLDPFYQDRVFVDDSILPIPGAYIELRELLVSKLSTFELKEVHVSMASLIPQRYNVVVDAEVPVIDVDVGHHNFSIKVIGLSFFGAGDAKIAIIKPRIKVTLLVGARLRLTSLHLNIQKTHIEFGLADIQPAITGIFHDPSVEDFVNLFLRFLVLELVDTYSDLITETVSPIVQEFANDILKDINFISLLE